MREEGQLETRFRIAYLPRWSVGPVFAQFLSAFERSLPLKRHSGLAAPDMQQALLDESGVMQRIPGITHGIEYSGEDDRSFRLNVTDYSG